MISNNLSTKHNSNRVHLLNYHLNLKYISNETYLNNFHSLQAVDLVQGKQAKQVT